MMPLRILLVAPSPPPYGGMALQARQLEQLLRADRHSVEFFPSNFPLPRLAEGLPYVRTLLRYLLVWPRMWKAAGRADIVHVFAASWFYFFAIVYPAVIAGRLRGKRVVINYRGGEAAAFFSEWGWMAAPILRLAHQVSAPSRFLAAIIEDRFRVPVRIVPNIVNPARFPFRRRSTFAPKLLVTRHLEAIYDIATVLGAFRRIQDVMPEASLVIAGTGEQAAKLESLARSLELRNVRFTGAVPHGALAALYDDCDIYINASRVDNFPGALIEASAAGLAIVSTCAGGIPHIYEHEKNALLAPVGDPEALAGGVVRLVNDPGLARRLVDEALRIVRQSEWEQVRPRLYLTYGVDGCFAPREAEVATGLH